MKKNKGIGDDRLTVMNPEKPCICWRERIHILARELNKVPPAKQEETDE
jgi:hypothetical protein